MFVHEFADNHEQGRHGETLVCEYLRKRGFIIVKRNFRFQRKEIDIIASFEQCLYFIEVKTRSGHAYGKPYEAVTSRKIKNMMLVASYFMSEFETDSLACMYVIASVQIVTPSSYRLSFHEIMNFPESL